MIHCGSNHHTKIQATFVCLFVCVFPISSEVLEGFFSEKVNWSLSLSTILYMRQPHATQLQKAPFALLLVRV